MSDHQDIFATIASLKEDFNTNHQDLKKEMKEGFTVTHQKQDYTNGRVKEAELEIIELRSQHALLQKDLKHKEELVNVKHKNNKILWWIITILLAIISTLIGYIVNNGGIRI